MEHQSIKRCFSHVPIIKTAHWQPVDCCDSTNEDKTKFSYLQYQRPGPTSYRRCFSGCCIFKFLHFSTSSYHKLISSFLSNARCMRDMWIYSTRQTPKDSTYLYVSTHLTQYLIFHNAWDGVRASKPIPIA